jgi:transformation/transcription domain-associated protein
VNELVLQTASSHKLAREVAQSSLIQIADLRKISLSSLLTPYKSFFTDLIVFSPAKTYLRHQPLDTQIGIMEANYFCASLEPKLVTFENYQFLTDVKLIIKCDDDAMSRCDAYKDVKLLPELRESAMKVLVSWHYIYHNQHYDTEKVKNINFCDDAFVTLFKALEVHQSLQETAFKCLKKLIDDCKERSESGWPIQHSFLETLGDYSSWTPDSIKRLSYYCLLFPKMFTEKTCEQLFEIVKKLIQNSIVANKDQNYLKIAKTGEKEQKIAAIIDLFHLIPTCTSKFVILLIKLLMATEESISLETTCPYRQPVLKFLRRYPEETITFLLSDEIIKIPQYSRFMIYLLTSTEGSVFRTIVENKSDRLRDFLSRDLIMNSNIKNESQYQVVLIISTIIEFDNQWLPTQMPIINALNQIWLNHLDKCELEMISDFWHLITKILLHYFEHNPSDIDLLYRLLNIYNTRYVPDFQFFRDFILKICENYTVDWKRDAFFLFVDYYHRSNVSIDLKIKIITMILIPSFAISFDKGEESRLIRGYKQDEESNIISVFINKIVNPFMAKENDDGLRIVLLQFACLLVERASPYIQSNRKEDIRQLTTFGYSSLLHSKNFWDPTAVYNGHLLLSHIIAKLANKKSWQEVVFKVFHSLLKAHAIEARNIVRQTLEVFMPMMPLKMNDQSNLSLINLTKSVIIKDGYAILQLYHVFQVIIRHHTIYYPVRHELISNMITSMQRLEQSNHYDYRKLAIDIAEVIINWELRRIEETNALESEHKSSESGSIKRTYQEAQVMNKKLALNEPSTSSQASTSLAVADINESNKPIEWTHCKSVINFLFDLLYMLSEQTTTQISSVISSNEIISKLSLTLLKKVLKRDVWIKNDEALQFTRLKKVFDEPSKASSTTICNFLEIFVHLLDEIDHNKILSLIKTLQPGLAICITSAQTKVLRLMSTFLSKLMNIFPVENYGTYDELRFLYQTVEKAIRNGLEIYEKDSETPTTSFFGTFLILKTAFTSDAKYFERFFEKFTRFVLLLKNEHLDINSGKAQATNMTANTELTREMLMQSLHLLKTHIQLMSTEARKCFINSILVELIEKSNDPKIINSIIQLVANWIQLKNPNMEPCFREKIVLLQKLTFHIENRFSNEVSLNTQFLELIYLIFSDPELNTYEFTVKLHHAFSAGLRSTQHELRQKFFKFFDKIVEKNVYTRLLYILSIKTLDSYGSFYWITQCIEMLITIVDNESVTNIVDSNIKLPSITDLIDNGNLKSFGEFQQVQDHKMDFDFKTSLSNMYTTEDIPKSINHLINSQMRFAHNLNNLSTQKFLHSVSQMCHANSNLSEKLFLSIFPQIWSNLTSHQRDALTKEIIQLLSAGTKINLKNPNLSAFNTLIQGLIACDPPIFIPPKLINSLSKIHNVWHSMALNLENMLENCQHEIANSDEDNFLNLDDNEDTSSEISTDVIGSISKMYSMLNEEDLYAGLWQKYAKYSDTKVALFYEQMGYFEEAQSSYESAMSKFKHDVNNSSSMTIKNEVELWENHWIKCTKELNEWSILSNYALTNRDKYAFLLVECAWKQSDINLMRQTFIRAEQLFSKQSNYKLNLYGGYISLMCQKENTNVLGKYIELASTASIQEWRSLPKIVSHVHIPVLQFAQQIMELQEAGQIQQDLLRKMALPFHDMKSIIKTWRNRMPMISDDLSYWKDIFIWRQHNYQLIIENANGNVISNLGSQASAQAYIKLGKIARKQNLPMISQKSLSDMDSIKSVPLSDCFQKIIQQIKCYVYLAQNTSESFTHMNDALKIIDAVNLDLFQAESKSLLFAYKGHLHTYLGNFAEANKAFGFAVDLCDSQAKSWAYYGDYMENIFKKNYQRTNAPGVSAVTCFLHASREHNELKARKHIAKIIWLLTYESARPEMLKAFENYMMSIPMINWLPWIPQLFNALVQYECDTIMNLINQIAKLFPQAVYFPVRTLYLTLKIEQRERFKNIELLKSQAEQHQQQQPGTSSVSQSNLLSIKSTTAMWRCSKIMQLVREIHPTIVCSIESILDHMMSKSDFDGVRWFRENVFEENLHQLKQALTKCYAIAFENRKAINTATITLHILNFIRKLVSNFSTISENTTESVLQDPVFQKLRQLFLHKFNFSQPESNRLLDLIEKLKLCISIMEQKVKTLPK